MLPLIFGEAANLLSIQRNRNRFPLPFEILLCAPLVPLDTIEGARTYPSSAGEGSLQREGAYAVLILL